MSISEVVYLLTEKTVSNLMNNIIVSLLLLMHGSDSVKPSAMYFLSELHML